MLSALILLGWFGQLAGQPPAPGKPSVPARQANSTAKTPAARPAWLQGRVRDANGLPVAGAETTLWEGRRSWLAYTSRAGAFRLGPLPAGASRLIVQKNGFYRLSVAVQLQPGWNRAHLKLLPTHELEQTVRVVSHPSPIEPESLANKFTLTQRDIRNLPYPTNHDLQQALVTIPGVLMDNSGQLHVAGARPQAIAYSLDGFDISDPATGQLDARLNVDAVRSVQVQSGRFGAQHPSAGAGVLSLHTLTGSNHLRFGTTNFLPGVSLQQGLRLGNWYPRFTLSGPLVKNRAWFADALSWQHTLSLVTQLPRGQNTGEQWNGDNLFSTQYMLTPRQELEANLLFNYTNDSYLGLSPFTPQSATMNDHERRGWAGLKDEITLGGNLIDLGVADDLAHVTVSPLGTAVYQYTPQGPRGNYFQTVQQTAGREQAIANVFFGSHPGWGEHNLRLGGDWMAPRLRHQALRRTFEIIGAGGARLQTSSFLGPNSFQASDTLAGFYAEDAWQLTRSLRVEPALRLDHDRLASGALPAPRLALNYLPWADNRTKLSAGWGVFYQPIALNTYGLAFDQQRQDTLYDSAGQAQTPPYTIQFALPGEKLKEPRYYTAYAGLQQALPERIYLGLRWLQRQERDGLAYENLSPAGPTEFFLLQNNRRDHYHALELTLRRNFKRAALFGDYIRSQATTNEAITNNLSTAVFSPQAGGPLPWDAPNRLLLWGWAPTHVWNILGSWFFETRSGFPFSVYNAREQLVGPPGRMRYPAYLSLNAAFERRFRFHHHEWALRLAVLNITNHYNPDAVIDNIASPGFLSFSGGMGRVFTGRLRLVGRH